MKRILFGGAGTRRTNPLTSEQIRDAIDEINRPRNRARVDPPEMVHFPRALNMNELPCNPPPLPDPPPDGIRRDFYIFPKEVLDFLEENAATFLYRRGNETFLKLTPIREFMERVKRDGENMARRNAMRSYNDFILRTDANFDLEKFLKREITNFFYPNRQLSETRARNTHSHRPRNIRWLSADYVQTARALRIPGTDVYDLPIYLMLYILWMLSHETSDINAVQYSIGDLHEPTRYTINDDNHNPVRFGVPRMTISLKNLRMIYLTILRQFTCILPWMHGVDDQISWAGSVESGTRIQLSNLYNPRQNYFVKLFFVPSARQNRGGAWCQAVEDLLAATTGASVISVRNKDNNKCLIYCLVLGLIIKMKENGARVFGLSTMMVEPNEIYCKGMYMFMEDEPVSNEIRKLSRLLMPPDYSAGSLDPLAQYVEDIDKKAGTMISVQDFRKEFSEIETKLISPEICGIDVYGIDFNLSKHIYPLYISKQRERVIELLCVTPKDGDCSHYALIMNMEKLMKQTGGKQFFSCSKCGQTFYHRRLLKDHHCPQVHDVSEVAGEGGYHYATMHASAEDLICGSCSKCRLCFTDDFTAEYHKEHCLMEGQTGFRHVQLKSYENEDELYLCGEEIDMEKETQHVTKRRLMYADFESSINPETGEHVFMSYGIYEWKTMVYKCGYSLEEFMDYIVETAFSNDEEQIYVYFHNAMGYDANFILRYVLGKSEYANWGIQVIMKSSNKLQKLVFRVYHDNKMRCIHIGDTFLFLTLSLERIVGSIRKDDIAQNIENFPHFFEIFHQKYPFANDREIDHILRKNIFPYKFFTDSTKLDTPIEEFARIFEPREENLQYFSERVAIEDLDRSYADTTQVMATFRCTNARDYHDLYLCCDVMQLADVFDRSMKILWESHHIHLPRYLGMPSASWAAFLRHDPTMKIPLYDSTFFAEFFKAMIRGGITSAVVHYAKADARHSIIYLDVNGLYPYVMQKYKFPCGSFTFMPFGWTTELSKVKLQEYFEMFERESKGMCFCVDLEIPREVKELTDMYPFAPEHRRIFKEYFSDFDKKELTPFLKRWSEANNGEQMHEFMGLVCTLYNKERYNVHWRLLKFYMEHGVIVKKVWFGVMFDEGDYLAGYIRKNIEIRNTRKDELGKTLYKLLGNSIYGKTFESPFKRSTYEIIKDPLKLHGLLEEGNIAAVTPIDDLGWIVKMDGENIILDKPTYIGACVCEFSKLHMYTLLYDKLFKIFPSVGDDKGCQLIYTDTDSFIVQVRHPEGVGSSPKELFDYIKSKDPDLIGGIGGQVKSETGEDETIDEIIALRSKVYAYKTTGGHIGKRAKGTTGEAQETQLDWETYQEVWRTLKSKDTHNNQFSRKIFKIASINVDRQSLSVNDGKRLTESDGIHTHAFGY